MSNQTMLTVPQIVEALRDRNLSVVSERLALNPSTLQRIMRGAAKVHRSTQRALSDYLQQHHATPPQE